LTAKIALPAKRDPENRSDTNLKQCRGPPSRAW
jgi:hypothetical protein